MKNITPQALIKRIAVSLVLLFGFFGASLFIDPVQGHASAAPSSNQAQVDCQKSVFFGLKPWYIYINDELATKDDPSKGIKKCDVVCFNILDQGSKSNECGQTRSDIPLVLLAIVDNLLRIAGIVAVGFVLYGAFKYVASQGSPEATKSAQETIINALLGLAIAITAVAFVSFLGNKLGG